MFIKVNNIKIGINESVDVAVKKALKKVRLSINEIDSWKILSRSIDARKKPTLFYVYSIGIEIGKSINIKDKEVMLMDREPKYSFNSKGLIKLNNRPVIV